jgi:hypothetical protein
MKKPLIFKKVCCLTVYWWLGIVLGVFLTGSPVFGTQNYMTHPPEEITTQDLPQKDHKKSNSNIQAMKFRDGKLTVNMSATALNQVMKEFSRITGIKVLWQGPESTRLVTLGFNDRTVDEAIRHMLNGENYMILFSSQDKEEIINRILILPNADATDNTVSSAWSSTGMEWNRNVFN